MKTEKRILIAFILNFAFSLFELFGGIYTGSTAIMSDSVHDIGDALSIGACFFLERKSKKKPDNIFTYGYSRYSLAGGALTSMILVIGSFFVIIGAINRILFPTEIKYNGMIFFAIIGLVVNGIAAFCTTGKGSLCQKAVNLHMIEDVLGWVTVLIGAIIMKYTNLSIIDPVMSVVIAIFILVNALKNLKEVLDIFLEKSPQNISAEQITEQIKEFDGVEDVHHIHIWSIDGNCVLATMHIVTNDDAQQVRKQIRERLAEYGISHVTLELENEQCTEKSCTLCSQKVHAHHHH